MKNRIVKLDDFSDSLYSFKKFKTGSTNYNDIAKMKSFLNIAIKNELTERQKLCIVKYFLENKKMKDIAIELDISKSAVSRHIKRGITVLKKRSIYLN